MSKTNPNGRRAGVQLKVNANQKSKVRRGLARWGRDTKRGGWSWGRWAGVEIRQPHSKINEVNM